MIARALVVALWCACAAALAPLTAPADDDCALYLTGPGRSSAYDYSLNLLKGNFGYEGQHTCITYEAINQAYLDARNRILVSQPKGDWKAEDFASVGELLLDISINLARTYGLTYEEIEKGLPLIDTSRTLIREACPPVFSHVECRAGKYRRLDGLCNNLRHPNWGATMAPFQRLIGPLFADGINAPRIAHNGHDLPLSRVVSRTMHPDDGFHDHAGTVMVIAWGQFMDHDYTLTGTPLDPINRNDPEECCKRPPHLKHPYCNEIRVPDDDYFYRLWGVKCIDFVRGFPSPRPGCRLGSRVPFNTLTGTIDGNTVYGVTEKFARKLRTGYGGLLRMNPVFKEYGLKDLLPLKLDIPDEGCTRPNKNMYCFEAGEIRVNEQLVLTVMHTLMAREHNRVAEGLAAVNPHWDDETLYQEARRINIAEIQHITYNEFLPILLGKDVMEKFGLVLEKEGYWNGYDPEVNPDVLDSFAAAAYRFGHSLLPTAVERWSKAHKFIASKRLSDLIRRPYDLYRAGVLDEYVMGLMNQVAQAMDDSITQEVTNHLFKKVGARFGMDLVSFNMQRGREFGLPGYMEFRKFCGLPGAETFQDLFGSMPNETVRKYESIFEHPIDVDLWSGGVSERPLPGSMLGPTFACIIATQFSYSRRGDRFWFELPNQPSSFTPEQLTEIRKARLARVICDNTDIIDTVQLYPMVLPDHELNPRVPCRSGIIPSMDFSKWAEQVPFHGAAKQFITEANATNNFVKCKDYMNKTNTTEEIKQNSSAINLCAPVISQLEGKINGNVTPKLHISQSSQLSTEKPLSEKHLDGINNHEIDKKEPNNINLKSTDALMKYVYKNTDKANLQNKSKGHSKNSILRKKRSLKEREPSAFYKTPYHSSHSEIDSYLPLKDIKREIIKNTGLADFNIETFHNDSKSPSTIKEKNKDELYLDIDISKHSLPIKKDNRSYEEQHRDKINKAGNYNDYPIDIDNSKHILPIKKDNRSYEPLHRDTIDREEKNTYNREANYNAKSADIDNSKESHPIKKHNRNYEPKYRDKVDRDGKNTYNKEVNYNAPRTDIHNSKHSHPIKEDNRSYEQHREIVEREEKIKYKPTERNSKESGESKEILYGEVHKPSPISKINNYDESIEFSKELLSDYRDSENSKTINHPENLRKSNIEKNNYENNEEHYPKKLPYEDSKSIENSKESSLFEKPISDLVNENYKKALDITNSPKPLQDVDLTDFSYERIQVNNKGQVEPLKDIPENYDSTENIHTTAAPSKLTSDKYNKHHAPLTVNYNASERLIIPDKQPIRINDEEVKPVVELNSENSESSEESPTTYRNIHLPNSEKYSSSEEDLHNKKIKTQFNENSGEKANIKQQFERIPVDYNHDDKSQKETNDREKPVSSTVNSDENINDGTVDSLIPKMNNYDEHLKTKFGDVSISLPEIKLPDDILSYARIGAPKENEGKYYYGDEDSDENPSEYKKIPYDTDEKAYYNIDSDRVKDHEDYKKPNVEGDDDDDDVDLYEKFVRERFGKDSSLGKKSEKLQTAENRPNSKLLETVQKILKKTEKVKDDAEKSGDPNAGYMWTLEYGEDL